MAMVMVIADACCFPDLLGFDRCLLVVWKEEDAGVGLVLLYVCSAAAIVEIEREKGMGPGQGIGSVWCCFWWAGSSNRKGSYLVGWVAAAERLLGCWKFWMAGPNMVF
ncbi:hypothetical protein KY289_034365 [Solanum tuberosum]|nr:hypothetical protein KY289_034365 [Solanum tuberosum]